MKRTKNAIIAAFSSEEQAQLVVDLFHNQLLPLTNARISASRNRPSPKEFKYSHLSSDVRECWEEKEELPPTEKLWVEKGEMTNSAFRVSSDYDKAFDEHKHRWSYLGYDRERVDEKGVAPLVAMNEMAFSSTSSSSCSAFTFASSARGPDSRFLPLLTSPSSWSSPVFSSWPTAPPPSSSAAAYAPPSLRIELDRPPHLHQRPRQQQPSHNAPSKSPLPVRPSVGTTFGGSRMPTAEVISGGIAIDSPDESEVEEGEIQAEEQASERKGKKRERAWEDEWEELVKGRKRSKREDV
jgi:hypothetical protein